MANPVQVLSELKSLKSFRLEVDGGRRLTSLIWPDSADKLLEVELAQLVLRSELLVTEDEEFINNYILTEDTMEQYKKELEGGQGSVMKDVLLFSGSLAAVAGAVFFFSERTRCVFLDSFLHHHSFYSEIFQGRGDCRRCVSDRHGRRLEHEDRVQGEPEQGGGGVQEDDQADAGGHEAVQDGPEEESEPDPGHGDDEPGLHQLCLVLRTTISVRAKSRSRLQD